MAFYLMLDRACIDAKLMIKSIAPLSMSLWWYATAYAIFLALLPFLSKGLKALGRKYHLALAITVLIIWGLTSFIPGSLGGYPSINSSLTGVFGFIYLFIIISAYKWYMNRLHSKILVYCLARESDSPYCLKLFPSFCTILDSLQASSLPAIGSFPWS